MTAKTAPAPLGGPADLDARADEAPLSWPGQEVVQPDRLDVRRIAFSGSRLLALLDRPAPPPVYAGVPTPGHLTLWVAPPMTGKTSLAAWVGAALAAGVSPWDQVPAPDTPRRVLYLSLDEAPEVLARRLRGLSVFHPAGPFERYADRLDVIGPDRETDPAALDLLHLDGTGLATIERWINEAAERGDPYGAVFIDAYADVLPLSETENSNEAATVIGGGLERIAVRSGVAMALLHHAGKPRAEASDQLPDVRYAGRGASALAAKARVVSVLEQVSGMPHLRRLRTATNLGRPPGPLTLQVCDPDAERGELLYFKTFDPLASHSPAEILGQDEVSTNELAWRLSGLPRKDGKSPPGEWKKTAAALRERWRECGLVTVRRGGNNSLLVRLAERKGALQ